MNILELLKHIGIESETFIAGASGAIVFLTNSNEMTKGQKFLTVLAGGLSANYLTPLVATWLNIDNRALYGIAFILGYSGMKSVEAIMKVFFNKLQK